MLFEGMESENRKDAQISFYRTANTIFNTRFGNIFSSYLCSCSLLLCISQTVFKRTFFSSKPATAAFLATINGAVVFCRIVE